MWRSTRPLPAPDGAEVRSAAVLRRWAWWRGLRRAMRHNEVLRRTGTGPWRWQGEDAARRDGARFQPRWPPTNRSKNSLAVRTSRECTGYHTRAKPSAYGNNGSTGAWRLPAKVEVGSLSDDGFLGLCADVCGGNTMHASMPA